MRVLLAHHFPESLPPAGAWAHQLGMGLRKQGHDVRLLHVDRTRRAAGGSPLLPVRTVVCRRDDPTADLPFELPGFEVQGSVGRTFASLSHDELAAYRQTLREHLDGEVEAFDPHVIHVQHIWVLGQLALETGVPYVVTAWGPELGEAVLDERFKPLAEQAAENAGRILAADTALMAHILKRFEGAHDRTMLEPPTPADHVALYQSVLNERFG